ncbi:fibronectin type III domain-containing protein 7-like [Ambystoma mexicanum]|uniref:fibronectin type III domain-containing protein 7-like n=1 Tax=Ambystoma mexicanum TaxID=8296 RepID=UPI0037E81B63
MDGGSAKFFILVGIILTCCQTAASQSAAFPVSIFELTERSFYVTWAKYPGTTSYKVTATPVSSPSTQSAFAVFNSATVMGTLNTLLPDTIYDVAVEAYNSVGNIIASSSITHRTAPEIPVIDQAYSKVSNSITVEWAAVPGASEYLVTARDGDLFYETKVPSSPGTVTGLNHGVLYKMTIRSINSAGKSQPSRPKWAQTVLPPANVGVSSPSSSSVQVQWDPVDGAVSYSVSIMRSDGLGNRTTVNSTVSPLTVTGLDPGTPYTITVHAWDANGNAGDIITLNQVTRPDAPAAGQINIDISNLDATFSWNNTAGTTEYVLMLSSGPAEPELNCTSSSSSCTITALQCGTLYSVSIAAVNDAGSTVSSSGESLLTVPCAPGGITISEENPGSLFVTWSAGQLNEYYVVFVKSDDGLEVNCNTSATQCSFPSECGFTYFISVFAYNRAGQSALGDVLNYTTAPCCPGDVSPVYISSDTLEIVWSPVRGAEIYETKAVSGSSVILCNDTSTVCALSALQCDTTYNVTVYSFSELRGSNTSCPSNYVTTAPCSPEILNITTIDTSTFDVYWESGNKDVTYIATAGSHSGSWNCTSAGTSCSLTGLPCGCVFLVHVVASRPSGMSLPSYGVPIETDPCCPTHLSAVQVTQSMTNVSWSTAVGAMTYTTMLTSPKGQAKCHTLQNHCVLGCITCGSNYSVSLEAISETGRTSVCTYQGYSSSACCPMGVKLYRLSSNGIRVNWRASPDPTQYSVDLYGSKGNFTCSPSPGSSYCDVTAIPCGDVYTVVVAPVGEDGLKLTFCPKKIYSVTCSGSSVGMVIYRGKRSAE